MKTYQNDEAIEKSGTNRQCQAIVPKYLYCSVILISFHFAHALLMTTVDSKVINILNKIYLNTYHTLLFVY